MILDHPLTRADSVCPFCGGHKDRGLVACWPCHWAEAWATGGYTDEGEAVLDQRESELVFIEARDNHEPTPREAREQYRAARAVARWKGLE